MFNLRVLCQDHPQRTIALVTTDHALIFHYSAAGTGAKTAPRCQVEFSNVASVDLKGYRSLGAGHGTLGMITLGEDVFVCVVTGSSQAAMVRPGESVSRIDNVDFYCLNRAEYEYGLDYETNTQFAAEDREGKDMVTEHPFLALKKLLGDGSFYYSLDFNLTDRLQDRSDKSAAFDIDSLDEDMLWNSYMIHPLLLFRSHLPPPEKAQLDESQLLTCVIRGYANTLKIPATVPILPHIRSKFPSLLSIISRQSSRRAGTRFNSRGIDDDGNVANFVETEVTLWVPPGIAFSYAQLRGSLPIFWEQTPGLIPGQQKIEITRSSEATQHAFNKHFETLELAYGAVHVVNLLSELRSGEAELSAKFRQHISRSSLRQKEDSVNSAHNNSLLRMTEYDFLAETRGPSGYEASGQIKYELADSLDGFAYFLSEDTTRSTTASIHDGESPAPVTSVILQQDGVFRTNCLDCLDRTNLVQTIISSMALESFLSHQGCRLSSELQMRHSTLWADNGDALSKIYAGTGALKSSFTRHGKMSLAGALADARKSATRLYVNNFTDKSRQKTIDILLGRLANQIPVHLYDPMNDLVTDELNRRASEYSSTKSARIWIGTFNVNGRDAGPGTDLSPWLFPDAAEDNHEEPVIFAVGFQEIVDLSPQQIMSTDPGTRKVWEKSVQECLNRRSKINGTSKYVLLRSGQLVGAALMIYVKADSLKDIKNVEGTVKKTGMSGIAGNKGGCAIRFDFSNTSICFVTAHLAAGFANYDERNRDYETIDQGLRFQKNRAIADHDTVIWLGDFNYRVGLGNQIVRDLVSQRDYQKLYDNDQLNLQMIAGRAFQFYSEGPIGFAPTYKYDIGTDHYDTSEKSRIPAWCDRILWRGANMRQTSYNVADLRISDHRPVFSTFDCLVDVIDHGLKDSLRRNIYEQKQRNALSDHVNLLDLDDDESILQDPIAPGLPPASSDRSKWWLENGVPVKATIKPPREGLIANSQRASNPFTSDAEPDWISKSENNRQHGLGLGPGPGPGAGAGHGGPGWKPQPPPRQGTMSSQASASTDTSSTTDIFHSPIERVNSAASASSAVAGTRTGTGTGTSAPRSPPAIPRKPISLTSQSTSTSIQRSPVTVADSQPQSQSARNQALQMQGGSGSISTSSPSTPARSNSAGVKTNMDLLGDSTSEQIEWKPLLPQR